jgi:hypothetical protein
LILRRRERVGLLGQDGLILKRQLALFVCWRIAFAKNRFPLFSRCSGLDQLARD